MGLIPQKPQSENDRPSIKMESMRLNAFGSMDNQVDKCRKWSANSQLIKQLDINYLDSQLVGLQITMSNDDQSLLGRGDSADGQLIGFL